MLISQAFAADTAPAAPATTDTVATTAVPTTDVDAAAAKNPTEGLMFNLGFIILLFVFFYVLMIRPQQRRMKEQQGMLSALGKGDRVITNGGIIGTIVKTTEGTNEVEIEIADGVKVTMLRYSIYKKYDPTEFTSDKKAA